MEHTKENALAKASWANEEQVVRLILQHRQVHRLVDIIVVLLNDFHKVRHSIGYAFYLLHKPPSVFMTIKLLLISDTNKLLIHFHSLFE